MSLEYGGLTRNVTVKDVMDTWTTQTGYPLITVTRDYTDSTLFVTQVSYYYSKFTRDLWEIFEQIFLFSCMSEMLQRVEITFLFSS